MAKPSEPEKVGADEATIQEAFKKALEELAALRSRVATVASGRRLRKFFFTSGHLDHSRASFTAAPAENFRQPAEFSGSLL